MSPDITMCKDEQCPLRWKCFRFMAIPSERQSYFAESPREVARCEYFEGSFGRKVKEKEK